MHPLFFSFKRTYWSSMRFSRVWAAEYELTPARIDMLLAIFRKGDDGIAQSELRDALDVCPAVVSRMLKSLAKRGYVHREEHPDDRRQRWITLTARCRRVLHTIIDEVFHDGVTEAYIRVLVAPDATRSEATDRALFRIREILRRQRPWLTDVATFQYPAYLADGSRSPDFPAGQAVYTPAS